MTSSEPSQERKDINPSPTPAALEFSDAQQESASLEPIVAGGSSRVLYSERQWVPWYWWAGAAFVAFLFAATVSLNRDDFLPLLTFIIAFSLFAWVLFSWSSTRIQIEQDDDGTRWLLAKEAQLPNDVVARSLAVPKSARRLALGPQLDPAAFLVTHQWVDDLVMLVLNDESDPTPYWLVSSKNPAKLLRAFVPDQAEEALRQGKSL